MDERTPFDVSRMLEEDIAQKAKEAFDPIVEGRKVKTLPANLTKALAAAAEIEKIIDERQKTYGDFTENAQVSQALKFVMEGTAGWKKLSAVQAEVLHQCALKTARILTGDPNSRQHWDDLAGYPQLVCERLPK